jgi:sarcosine oxidase subunit beta
LREAADAVVIGGGVVGCSIAYNLAKKGYGKVVVLERGFLASGATGRCGAGVRAQWGAKTNCRLAYSSIKMFSQMNEMLETKRDIEFKQGGYLLLAFTENQWRQFQANVTLQNSLGIPSRLLTPKEAREIVPFLNTEGLVGATYCHEDGHCNPFQVTLAYADAARRHGAKIRTYVEATGILTEGGRIRGVLTEEGEISTPITVVAAGGHSADLARMVGVELPIYSERHQILVTEQVEPVLGPMVMSFHHGLYCQQTPDGSFIMGIGDPNELKGYVTTSSWHFLEEMAGKITGLLPPVASLRVVRQWAGLYDISPDAHPILGQAPYVEGFYLACGFSGHGFMIAPMVSRLLAQAICDEEPEIPLESLGLARFGRGELLHEPSVV